uniref:Myb/SANT-like domain-containing protein n=1 Tax=Nelumbo nucifera TaxID=4432 RepID=A0A822ZMP4_NELNU|nr:TPA_asm: hypothetical protein HUJ06_001278 [Nelumbo nucifera]
MSTQNQISSNSLSSSSSSSSSSLEKKPGTPENAGKESVSLPEHAKKRIASLNFTDQGNSSRKAFRTSGNQVEMSNKDVGIKQLRWTPAMDRCLLLVLAKEAREGKKGDKGFKKPSYARAASYVSKKFGVLCTADNVENRLRTTKKRYNFIMALQRNSEFGWDDTQKMITAHVQAYNDYIANQLILLQNMKISFWMRILMLKKQGRACSLRSSRL